MPGVRLGGHVPESILHGLFAGAVALLYPSNYEGFGLPIVEAMACGCPVITLRNSALVESAGDAAWYVERVEAGMLAEGMRTLFEDDCIGDHFMRLGLQQAGRLSRERFAAAVQREVVAAACGETRSWSPDLSRSGFGKQKTG
jgi:alpha-1,3-rhamnosyl/mannosyltransferase